MTQIGTISIRMGVLGYLNEVSCWLKV